MSTKDLLLGEGAYARVYKKDGSALKIAEIGRMDDLISAARELFILRKNIPGCVPYRSCYFKWNAFHTMMEKATDNLSKIKIDPLIVAIQVIHTLYKMHELQILHRDLKPDNILIKGDKVWICDFGLSRQFSNDYSAGTGYMCTRYYRAPEIWAKKSYDDRADMWSVGCILHRMVHGSVPGKDLDEIFKRVSELKGDSTTNILIKNLLILDPKKRWSAEEALVFLKEKPEKFKDRRACGARVNSSTRVKWFKLFRDEFPDEHRVLSHGLMLFDKSCQDSVSMCCAMALAAMIFKTRPCEIINFATRKLRDISNYKPLTTLCNFIPSVCDGEVSDWDEVSFDDYITSKFKNNKRKLTDI
jgi:serine/threonine protein kinase